MNEDKVSMTAAYIVGAVAFVLLAIVADGVASMLIEGVRHAWMDGRHVHLIVRDDFWIFLTALVTGGGVAFALAWMLREITAIGMRVALFAAYAFVVSAFVTLMATATGIHAGIVSLWSDDYPLSLVLRTLANVA